MGFNHVNLCENAVALPMFQRQRAPNDKQRIGIYNTSDIYSAFHGTQSRFTEQNKKQTTLLREREQVS